MPPAEENDPLRGAPRLPARGGAARKALRSKDARRKGVCNAPYARVLRAQNRRKSNDFAGHKMADAMSPIIRRRLTLARKKRANPLIAFVILRLTPTDAIRC